MVSEKRSQVKGHLGQGHEIFRVGVKLINARVLKVSSRSAAFYASYSRKTMGGGVHPTPPRTHARVKLYFVSLLLSLFKTFIVVSFIVSLPLLKTDTVIVLSFRYRC